MFVWTVLVFLDQMIKKEERRKKKEERTNLPLLDLSALPQVKKEMHHTMSCRLRQPYPGRLERHGSFLVRGPVALPFRLGAARQG